MFTQYGHPLPVFLCKGMHTVESAKSLLERDDDVTLCALDPGVRGLVGHVGAAALKAATVDLDDDEWLFGHGLERRKHVEVEAVLARVGAPEVELGHEHAVDVGSGRFGHRRGLHARRRKGRGVGRGVRARRPDRSLRERGAQDLAHMRRGRVDSAVDRLGAGAHRQVRPGASSASGGGDGDGGQQKAASCYSTR